MPEAQSKSADSEFEPPKPPSATLFEMGELIIAEHSNAQCWFEFNANRLGRAECHEQEDKVRTLAALKNLLLTLHPHEREFKAFVDQCKAANKRGNNVGH